MKDSEISWTHHTFNLWWGCARISPGCVNCYADNIASRWGHELWRRHGPRKPMSDQYWRQPRKWNREAADTDGPVRVFCASMADVFEDHPEPDVQAFQDKERARLWDLIEATPNLTWMLLTKRPENVTGMVPWGDDWPSTVWLGTSVEDQRRADERIPILLETPARVHFISAEPLLGPINLSPWLGDFGGCVPESGERCLPGRGVGGSNYRHAGSHLADCHTAPRWMDREGAPGQSANELGACHPSRADEAHSAGAPAGAARSVRSAQCNGEADNGTGSGDLPTSRRWGTAACPCCGLRRAGTGDFANCARRPTISWIICGGESGRKARPMHPDWVRALRDQCTSAGVSFHFKQWGEYAPTGAMVSRKGNDWTPTEEIACVGKKNAGRVLDGRTWGEFPAAAVTV